MRKNKRNSRIDNAKTNVGIDFWLVLFEREKLALSSCEYEKCIVPARKWFIFLKLPQTKNRKLYFFPMFQKVELRESRKTMQAFLLYSVCFSTC